MSGGYLLVVICLSTIQSTYQELAIESTTQITYDKGEDVTLTCNVTWCKKIVWKRWYNPVPISIGKRIFVNPEKYALQGNQTDFQLTIKSPRRSDAGVYACIYKSAGRKIVQRFELTQRGEASVSESISGSTSVRVACGGTAKLHCVVKARKPSKAIWMDKRGRYVSVGKTSLRNRYKSSYDNGSWQLKIRNVTDNDYGHFTCMVKGDTVMAVDVFLNRKGNTSLCSSVLGDYTENTTSPTNSTQKSDGVTTLSTKPRPSDPQTTGLVILGVGICGVLSGVICVVAICTVRRITHLTSTALRRVAYKEPRTEETSLSRWNFSMSTQYESRSSVAPPLANIRNYRRSSSMGATTGVHAASSMHSSYPSSAPHSLLIPGGCVCEHAPDVSPEHSVVEEEETTDAVAV
ncbi:uncharacterized protein LOC124129752 [Haliotis rufescens]|uniref:uncharacterized protein LOC124129752 n=1 Tax=Haliotis rufescens TaxID=6454 RepID=UPI00201F1146|nr:uncharacterized protein LOC124129752 [Haliotis rufescens]